MAEKTKTKRNLSTKSQIKSNKLELLVTIVDINKAEFFVDLIQSYEVNMQMVCRGQGTATDQMIQRLGLVKNDKAVIFSVVKSSRIEDILYALENKFKTVKNGKGIAYTTPLSSLIGVAIFTFLSNNVQAIKG